TISISTPPWRRSSRHCSFRRATRPRPFCRHSPPMQPASWSVRSRPWCCAPDAACVLVRPFGARVFGRLGDLVGRKYTFLVTILFMGASTFAVGLLPTFSAVGWLAPVLMVSLRLIQGLALGGEYGGAATYVAEHAPNGRRG